MDEHINRLRFPRLVKATLHHFSLYNLAPDISIEFTDGVFCLAGANGLGKSTFLSALNFALTGIVGNPERTFESVEEFYKHSIEFSKHYFKGRITERDIKTASISLELVVNGHHYELNRSVLEPTALRSLTIREVTGKRKLILGTKNLSPDDRHDEYVNHLVHDIGLAGFDQFVFLQHFILTFDERRYMLFWNKKPLEQAMYLAFGVDLAQAKRADKLRQEADGADSLARNFNWQATEVRKRIANIEAALKSNAAPSSDIVAEHQALTETVDAARKRVAHLEGEQRDVNLRLATLSSEQVALRAEYSKEVAKRVNNRLPISQHPLIVTSRAETTCGLCGATGPKVIEQIQAHVESGHCPLCSSELSKAVKPREIDRLRHLDQSLVTIRQRLDEAIQLIGRIANELEAAREGERLASSQLADFELENSQFLEQLRSGSGPTGLSSMLEMFRSQMDGFLKRKRDEYQRRDDKRRELRKLQEVLAYRYKVAEVKFVPLFRDLAFRFLGLEFDIRMETTQNNPNITLLVDVTGSTRRDFHQLSESQRFFIDIALRMALAQFMSAETDKATLSIDTPEGSLDIAYESRAGDMLAMYAGKGFPVIMTANINTSKLLLSLAKKLGRRGMVLSRMTNWAELSEVQAAEEDLFNEAYDAIEACLDGAKKRA